MIYNFLIKIHVDALNHYHTFIFPNKTSKKTVHEKIGAWIRENRIEDFVKMMGNHLLVEFVDPKKKQWKYDIKLNTLKFDWQKQNIRRVKWLKKHFKKAISDLDLDEKEILKTDHQQDDLSISGPLIRYLLTEIFTKKEVYDFCMMPINYGSDWRYIPIMHEVSKDKVTTFK